MKKIVIVDNDKVSVEALANILMQEGYAVFKAYDGVEGLNVIHAHLPDFVILDLFMPWIDGVRLCRYMREYEEFEQIGTILLSPLTLHETTSLMQTDADIYIAKGYIMDVADNALRSIRLLQDKSRKLAPEERALGFEGRSPRVVVEELLDERRHYETIMYNVGDGIVETNADHTVVYVNPAGKKIIHKPETSIVGHNISDVLGKRYDGEFQETLFKLQTSKASLSIQMPMLYGKKTLEIDFANLLSEQKSYNGALMIFQDVSYLTERIRELTLLNDVGRLLTSTLNFNEVLHIVMSQIQKIMGVEAASLLLIDHETDELTFEVALGAVSPDIKKKRLPSGQGIVGWVAQKGKPLLIPDVSKEPRFERSIDEATGFTTRSMICVPLIIREQVIGVIQVINRAEDLPFTEHNMELLSSIAMYASIGIEHAQMDEKFRQA